MKKQKNKKIIYYSDELNDDFAGTKIKTRELDENFKYVHKNIFWRFFSFIFYYIFAIPFAFIYIKLILGVKFVNRKSVKTLKESCFIYGNHTGGVIDAFVPNLISQPRRNRVIVNPDAVSIFGLKNFTQMVGAVPVPSNAGGMRKFVNALEYFIKKDNITVYPEAHIWPYYTGVRPFKDTSFTYPVKFNKPIIVLFVAYSKPKGFLSFLRKANITVYVSDPIYPNSKLNLKEARKDLRDKAYNFMMEKSKFSDYEVIKYIKKDKNSKK